MAVEIVTTVLASAKSLSRGQPYDLTDLKTVKDELSVAATDSSNDAFLQRAITQTSAAIANACNRIFPVEVLQDQIFIQQDPYPYQVPGGVYPLQLSRWPLANVSVSTFTGTSHGTAIVDGIASTANLAAGTLVFAADGSVPAGTTIQSVATNAITLTKPTTSSVAGLSFTTGIQVIQTLSVGSTQTLTYGTDFTVDAKRGWLIRLNSWTGISVRWEAEPVVVQYQAGYTKIPDDLVDICLRLVTARFRARGRDPMLVERSQGVNLGTERYWVGSQPGQRGAFAPEIEAILDNYRVPVTA